MAEVAYAWEDDFLDVRTMSEWNGRKLSRISSIENHIARAGHSQTHCIRTFVSLLLLQRINPSLLAAEPPIPSPVAHNR